MYTSLYKSSKRLTAAVVNNNTHIWEINLCKCNELLQVEIGSDIWLLYMITEDLREVSLWEDGKATTPAASLPVLLKPY